MRFGTVFLGLWATVFLAEGLPAQTLANPSACYLRVYDNAHLAGHPDQRVERISLQSAASQQSPPDGYDYVGILSIVLKTDGEPFSGVAYCRDGVDRAVCDLEGDGGQFAIRSAGGGAIQIDVGKGGIGLEGMVNFLSVSGTSGDDRSFVLRPEKADACSLGF